MVAPAEVQSDFLLPNHEGPWTLKDVLALPEDHSQRIELVDGMLLVSPLGSYRHQRLVGRVFVALDSACPAQFEATVELNVALSSGRLLIPDFTVVKPCDADITFPVSNLVLAGEVLSKSTRMNDLVLKRHVYAEAAVPYYLIIDPLKKVVEATLLELNDEGEYVEIAQSDAGVLTIERPFPVTIELPS
ncbi:Uma2 family endonuclease [Lentzea sp. NEAU-D7]|uniref:Uma2 family endonuclease n=1 Tax=Lentzea sp. NEAU-D7 TaxID=2994667 RepID=UPI00224A65EF|nr:Uma2 family endonuclease [Lentzea sp. NEAU-D7]MCX2955048.1 Uma2 family endonuclease [Lentzea sp. NEAU-D7]